MTEDNLIRQHFDSLEEMADCVRDWDIEFEPLAADRSSTELIRIELGPLLISHLDTNCAHAHRGASPHGAKTFALLADGNQTVHWCRRRIDERRLPFFESSQEFEATAHPRFNIYTLTLNADQLEANPAWHPLRKGLRRIASPQRRVFQAGPQAISELRNLIAATLRLFLDDQLRLPEREACIGLGEDIVNSLLSGVSVAVQAPERVSARARSRALRRALEYLEESSQEAVRMNKLCQFSKVSERTLQRTFLEHFGVTPKAYIRTYKLYRVRARLLTSEPREVLIRDLAMGEGFWHMGQFAQDYRRMFRELPSQTLARPSERSAQALRGTPI